MKKSGLIAGLLLFTWPGAQAHGQGEEQAVELLQRYRGEIVHAAEIAGIAPPLLASVICAERFVSVCGTGERSQSNRAASRRVPLNGCSARGLLVNRRVMCENREARLGAGLLVDAAPIGSQGWGERSSSTLCRMPSTTGQKVNTSSER